MLASERYRAHAADCLKAAGEDLEPHRRRLHLDLAASWLKLANQDDVVDRLIARWAIVAPAEATLVPD
jgi:hypothetical protein